jgi:hypothetical protein
MTIAYFVYRGYLRLLRLTGLFFGVPFFVRAAEFGQIDFFVANVITFINETAIPLIFAFGLLAFIWGMFRYFILGGAHEESRAKGLALMWHSILGFVMMVVIIAIVNLIAGGVLDGMGMPNDTLIDIPFFSPQ